MLALVAANSGARAGPDATPSAPSVEATPSASPAASPSAPAASELPAVMNRYVSALGGREVLASIKTQTLVYSFPLLGRVLVVRTTTKVPSFYLQVTQAEGGTGKISVGFDGKTAWSQGPDGVTTILTGEKRASVISDAAGGNDSEIFTDRWPTTVALKPAETHDGKTYVVLSIMPKGGINHDVFLDPQTYQPMMERTVESDATSISVVNAMSKGPLGELEAQSITTTRSDGFPQVTAALRFVRNNADVSDSIFAPPLGKGTETI